MFPSTAGSLAGKVSTTNFAAQDRVVRVRFSPNGSTLMAVDGKGFMHAWHTARPKLTAFSMQVSTDEMAEPVIGRSFLLYFGFVMESVSLECVCRC